MRMIFIYLTIFSTYIYASIGHISAIRGDVFVERDGKESKAFKGFKLESKDIIKTTKRSKAQFRFSDNTVIRVGRNSVFEIEDFLFDRTNKSKAKFKVKKGFFSAVTGQIGKVSKNRFKLKTTTSTIGIRGTHFQGFVKNDSEDIACLKGAIFVEINGQSIDILAGEIMNIKAGMPSNPRAIKAVDIENMEDKDALENANTPEMANMKYDALLSERLTETELIKSLDGKVVMSIHTWTKPDGITFKDFENAKPFDVSIEANMENLSSVALPNSWDGTFEGGKILKYSGDIIFVGELSSDGSAVLSENGSQKISIMLDTTNQFVSGEFDYLNKNIAFSNSGNGAVTQANFLHFSNNILVTDEENQKLLFPEQGGYFTGDNIYAKLGVTDGNIFELTAEEQENSKIISGGFIASKVEDIDIVKKEIDKDDIFSWGYWAYQDNGVENLRGGWVKPNIEITSKEQIAEFKNNSVTASYSGDLFGTIENSITNMRAEAIQNGSINLEFDFMANNIDGDIRFKSEAKDYGLSFDAKDMIGEDGSFAFKQSSTTIKNGTFNFKDDSISTSQYLQGSGNFYGNGAENIAGGVTAGFKNGDTLIAGFKGSKD